MNEQRVLPAKVYDALTLSAAMYGGIGAGAGIVGLFGVPDATPIGNEVPVCFHGHAWCAGYNSKARIEWDIKFPDSDAAVRRINARNGVEDRDARVPFEAWCVEMNVVRGPEEQAPAAELPSASEALVEARS